MPLQGQVPTSATLVSPDDGGLRATVLSRWNDGSAAVMVVASSTTVTAGEDRVVRLQSAAVPSGETNLTAARVGQLVNVVTVDCGALGRAEIRDFSNPERVWWANPQTVCARYRAAVSGHATLEAVIDVHAYAANSALVEVVLENCKMLTSAVVRPAAVNYTGATVSVNGGPAVATVNSSAMPVEGTHAPFRAWYASAWVGSNGPAPRVTQNHIDLQKHPLLFKCDQAATFNMAAYAGDTYVPWGSGRQRPAVMGGGGDHSSIGPLPQWETHFLQSGDARAAKAVEASALAVLGYNINYRDSATGVPPTFSQLKANNVSQNGYGAGDRSNWPSQGNSAEVMTWEVAHHPAVGLMAFIVRPSPVFIELAQKVAVWNGTWSVVTDQGFVTTTGVFGNFFQTRGRAWCLRSLAHATFLTPDGHAWKAPAKVSITDNVNWLDVYRSDSRAKLNMVWDYAPSYIGGGYAIGAAGHGVAAWMQHYLITEVHKVASAGLLADAAQTAINTLADWLALQPVRWINEQSATGAWRHIPYATVIGKNTNTIDGDASFTAQMLWWFGTPPAAVAGGWLSTGNDSTKTYSAFLADTTAGAYYPSYFWAALVAAVERNVAGASTAWATVQNNLTGLGSWRAGFAADPRWGCAPRNV